MAVIAAACLGLGLFGGCVAGIAVTSAPPPASPPPAAATAPSTSSAASVEPSPTPSTPPSAEPSATPSPVREIKVPDVVGMNHQAAQDLLQSRGLYMLQEQDATGQNRVPVWDRNWTVVRQRPKAGTRVTEDETITLYSKKIE